MAFSRPLMSTKWRSSLKLRHIQQQKLAQFYKLRHNCAFSIKLRQFSYVSHYSRVVSHY
jgi:hypothetical protein